MHYFRKAHVPYPPKKIALLIFKTEKRLDLWATNKQGQWTYVVSFHVLAAHRGLGPKLRAYDGHVPEGIYKIVELNPDSHYDVSMRLNYPNGFDRLHAKLDHRTHLGGNIFIHGSDLSVGCIAMGDRVIPELFTLVDKVGKGNVTVIIAPNDLRVSPPLEGREQPKWLPTLYKNITVALDKFPIQPIRYG